MREQNSEVRTVRFDIGIIAANPAAELPASPNVTRRLGAHIKVTLKPCDKRISTQHKMSAI
jgi:hypothetical protein